MWLAFKFIVSQPALMLPQTILLALSGKIFPDIGHSLDYVLNKTCKQASFLSVVHVASVIFYVLAG